MPFLWLKMVMKEFLKVENLCFGYLKRPLCLKDVNFSVKKNDRVLILGLEDKGKTSLIKTISGFDEHFFGNVYFEGEEIRKIPDENKCVSVIFDEPILLNSTIDKNLNFVYETLKKEIPSDIEKKELLDIFHLKFDLKFKIKRLSRFEKFKMCLIRVFIKKPKILFIDNILSHDFSQDEIAELKEIITLLMKDCLLFFTADNDSFVRYRDFFDWLNPTKVLYLNNSLVCEKHSIDDLFDNVYDLDVCSFSEDFEIKDGYCVFQEGDFYLSFDERVVVKLDKKFNDSFEKLKLSERENEDIILAWKKGLIFDLSKNNDVNNLIFEKKLMIFSKLDRSRVL